MLDIARTVFAVSSAVALQLRNYRLLKGVVFDAAAASEYFADCEVSLDAQGEALLQLKIFSENAKGLPVYHYAGEVALLGSAVVAQPYIAQLKDTMQRDASEFYRNGCLFHGESLQGLEKLTAIDATGLRMHCRVPDIATIKQGEFPIAADNIFANDLVYQALLVWVREQLGLGSLPASTASWQNYRRLQVAEPFVIELLIRDKKASSIKADVVLLDKQGLLLAEVKGAEVTASENLNKLFLA
jgi:hypothetical protein